MYSNEFIDLVNFSYEESEKFYKKEENDDETSPNPFYIGFGNPNAEIVIFGKEKGFKTTELVQLKYESINNPTEWKSYIDKGISINQNKFETSDKHYPDYINSFYPYTGKQKGGHTWSKYQKLMRNIYPHKQFDKCDFFKDCFISEINHVPSKLSEINSYSNKSRLDLLKHNFYKKKAIILACGDYLNEKDIEDIFDVKKEENYNHQYKNPRLIKYSNSDRILINTRQLSMNVSNDYLEKIAREIKKYL